MNNHALRFALLASVAAIAFDNKAGWKLDENGKVETKDGNPIWVTAEGAEQTMAGDTITRLNGEARGHRERAEKAEKTVEAFKDIDPETARKALETVGKLDAKKLIDAGEVDKVRDAVKGEYTGLLSEKDAALAKANSTISSMRIKSVFDGSEFIRDRVAMPRDFFEAAMVNNFKDEDGKVVAYDRSGNRIMSKKTVGEYAAPDEALELLVEMHPQKDTILRAPAAGGSGSQGGGGARGGGRYMSRGDFAKLGPAQQAEAAQKQSAGELTITE